MALRTPLYDRHLAHGARMVEFGGWDMPIQYTGIAGEPTTRPWLSADRLRMYFGSTRASGGTRTDLFVATRSSATAAFGAPVAIGELNGGTTNDSSPSLASDELTIVFESDRAGRPVTIEEVEASAVDAYQREIDAHLDLLAAPLSV